MVPVISNIFFVYSRNVRRFKKVFLIKFTILKMFANIIKCSRIRKMFLILENVRKFVKVFMNLKNVHDFKYVHEFKKMFMISRN